MMAVTLETRRLVTWQWTLAIVFAENVLNSSGLQALLSELNVCVRGYFVNEARSNQIDECSLCIDRQQIEKQQSCAWAKSTHVTRWWSGYLPKSKQNFT